MLTGKGAWHPLWPGGPFLLPFIPWQTHSVPGQTWCEVGAEGMRLDQDPHGSGMLGITGSCPPPHLSLAKC